MVHSDRGGHYRWKGWVRVCRANRLVRSMSRKGRSCDNARMEGFFGTLKGEFFHPRDWEGVDRDGFMVELHRWLKWFRSGRISESLGAPRTRTAGSWATRCRMYRKSSAVPNASSDSFSRINSYQQIRFHTGSFLTKFLTVKNPNIGPEPVR